MRIAQFLGCKVGGEEAERVAMNLLRFGGAELYRPWATTEQKEQRQIDPRKLNVVGGGICCRWSGHTFGQNVCDSPVIKTLASTEAQATRSQSAPPAIIAQFSLHGK
uniref:Uncharacterized protein n=1 Tax=Globodera rostochiensis TaxID=31243 RepID=A0A914HPR0_GLORO